MSDTHDTHNKSTGNLGERIAADFLVKKGYKIIASNFKTRYEEIDLIAEKSGMLMFIEVKTRIDLSHGLPEEAVTARKIKNISRAAEFFVSKFPNLPRCMQIDVVAIQLDADDQIVSIEHFPSVTS